MIRAQGHADELPVLSLKALAARANGEHIAAGRAAKAALDHGCKAGIVLLAAKSRVQRGEWAAWLAKNFGGSQQTADTYIGIAERWAELTAKRLRVKPKPGGG